MNRKTAIATTAVLLLAAVGATIYINRGESPDPAAAMSAGEPESHTDRPTDSTRTSGFAPVARDTKSKTRDPGKDAALIAQYGEARTNLSKHVSNTFVDLLADLAELAELSVTSGMQDPAQMDQQLLNSTLRAYGLSDDLQLTDEQKSQALAIAKEGRERGLQELKGAVTTLKDDPSRLTEYFLAEDAFKRGETSEAEFARTYRATNENSSDLFLKMETRLKSMGRPSLAGDAVFNQQFSAILDPDQSNSFQSAVEKQQMERERNLDNPGKFATDLQTRETTFESGRKMISGVKQIMEGSAAFRKIQEPAEGGN